MLRELAIHPDGDGLQAAQEPLAVLLVEDDPDDYAVTRELLEGASGQSYEIRWERTYNGALRAIREDRPSIVLLNHQLDGQTGFDVLKLIRGVSAPPVILLTKVADRQVELEAIEAGAADYLAKQQLDSRTLERTIRFSIERWRVELELRTSSSEYRLLAEAAPIGLGSIDADGRFLRVNQALEQILECPREELVGTAIEELVLLEDRREAGALLRRIRESSWGRYTADQRWVRRTGEVVQVAVSFSKVLDGQGRLQQVVVSVEDVTERRAVDDQLAAARTFDAVRRLSGGVAHDMNNAITSLRGFATLLEMAVAGQPEPEEYVAELREVSGRVASLARELNRYSRRTPNRAQPTDLNRALSCMQRSLQDRLPGGTELHVVQSLGLPDAHVDAEHLEEIVTDLARFCAGSVPERPEVSVATREVLLSDDEVRHRRPMPPGRYVELTISDNGSGTPPEHRGRMFEPFFTTRELGRGSGLGLAATYGLVKQNEAYVWAEGALGEGTVFRVFFPAIGRKFGTGIPKLSS